MTPVIIPFKYPSIKDVAPTPGKTVPGANAWVIPNPTQLPVIAFPMLVTPKHWSAFPSISPTLSPLDQEPGFFAATVTLLIVLSS